MFSGTTGHFHSVTFFSPNLLKYSLCSPIKCVTTWGSNKVFDNRAEL